MSNLFASDNFYCPAPAISFMTTIFLCKPLRHSGCLEKAYFSMHSVLMNGGKKEHEVH